LAEGCRKRGQTDWGVSVTGIAGPGGGSIEKPVGTVFIGCSNKERTQWRQFLFSGSRQEVRQQTAEQALCLLLDMMN
jgi:PncC family amidohydrolase